jgi:hypothetical protein
MGMIRFEIPKEAMNPACFLQTRYGLMPMTYEVDVDLRQWATDNFCKISLMTSDFKWYIDIPEGGNAALEYKLTWL